MLDTNTDLNKNIGWKDKPKNDPDVIKLINHLEANNGIRV